MIESFTMWRVKDKEFTDYAEAVRYEKAINIATNSIELFDSEGRPLTFEQAQEKNLKHLILFILNQKKHCFISKNVLKILGWKHHP